MSSKQTTATFCKGTSDFINEKSTSKGDYCTIKGDIVGILILSKIYEGITHK